MYPRYFFLVYSSAKKMPRYNAPPSVVTLYCAIYSISSPNADLRPICTARHMVHLVRSQPIYYFQRLFSHSGTLNVSGILKDCSCSQAFPTSQAFSTSLLTYSHSQRSGRHACELVPALTSYLAYPAILFPVLFGPGRDYVSYAIPGNQFLHLPLAVTLRTRRYCFLSHSVLGEGVS